MHVALPPPREFIVAVIVGTAAKDGVNEIE